MVVALLAALFGPVFLGPRILVVVLLAAAGVVVWRVVPSLLQMRDLRMLSKKL